MRPTGGACRFESLEARLLLTTISPVTQSVPGLVSVTAPGGSDNPAVSADGRFVAFRSFSEDLIEGLELPVDKASIFRHDLVTDETILVSRSAGQPLAGGNDESFEPVISADGRFIAYMSQATDLVAGQVDANDEHDIFLFDAQTGTTTLISHAAGAPATAGNARSNNAVITPDGAFVAFNSDATDLVAGFTENNGPNDSDVFLYEVATDTMTLISHATGSTTASGNDTAFRPDLSDDGRFVTFVSEATNLVAGFVDNSAFGGDIFLFDADDGSITLVSGSEGSATETGNRRSAGAVISADGRFVVYENRSDDVIAGQVDGNAGEDVFRYDVQTGQSILVSRSGLSSTTTADSVSFSTVVSDDGRFISYVSRARDLVPGVTADVGNNQVYLFDAVAGASILVTRSAALPTTAADGGSERPQISGDGRFIAYLSSSSNLVPGQVASQGFRQHVFLFDATTLANRLIDRAESPPTPAHAGVNDFALSNDGAFVVLASRADDLLPGLDDLNTDDDVFVFDRVADELTLVSTNVNDDSSLTALGSFEQYATSADGRFTVFSADARDLVEGIEDTNGTLDVFLFDSATATTTLVSRAAGAQAVTGDSDSRNPRVSGDGRFVVYESSATNLVPGQVTPNDKRNIFLFDAQTAETVLVSRVAGTTTTTASEESQNAVLSADGRFVAYESEAEDLVPGQVDANGRQDVFLFDALSGQTTLVSGSGGSATVTGDNESRSPVLSSDGRFVAFDSSADDLIVGLIGNDREDVFRYDAQTGGMLLVSHSAGLPATTGDDSSEDPWITPDGRFLLFESEATDLVAGQVDGNSDTDLFLFDADTGSMTLVSRSAGFATTTANDGSRLDERTGRAVSDDGRFVAFSSSATDLVAGFVDSNGTNDNDVFLFNAQSGTTTLLSGAAGSSTVGGNDDSESPSISSNGAFIAFESSPTT
ncbi:MAG: hypothetical protein CMJ18_09465 [Phycisphaeraceae bacterium]|nr:hypothetical protein [Phycisphaeraceae bacterium]